MPTEIPTARPTDPSSQGQRSHRREPSWTQGASALSLEPELPDGAIRYRLRHTTIGPLLFAGRDDVLTEIRFPRGGSAASPEHSWSHDESVVEEAVRQVEAFLAGERRDFDLRLAPAGTDFQRRVWTALLGIPYGATVSYGELAEELGSANASRAVGAANGRNPIPIVVPCHRVIGADGRLTGYAGGLDLKQRLLALEQGERSLF